MTDITSGQYQIVRSDGTGAVTYGMGAGFIQIDSTTPDSGSVNVQDQPVVGHDGLLFGVDTLPGMVVTQTGKAYTSPSQGSLALDAYSVLASAWNDPYTRLVNNSYQVLRAFYRGSSVIRRAYGRGRKITPTMGLVYTGQVPFVAQFQCADNNWYDDAATTVVIPIQARGFSSIIAPVKLPTTTIPRNLQNLVAVLNSGTLPTWPVFQITGPIQNPSVTYENYPLNIGYTGKVGPGQTLVIDTRPWVRSMVIGTASAAGGMFGSSALIGMQLPVGQTIVKYEGLDYLGVSTSTCSVVYRRAWQSIGGSS